MYIQKHAYTHRDTDTHKPIQTHLFCNRDSRKRTNFEALEQIVEANYLQQLRISTYKKTLYRVVRGAANLREGRGK